MRFNVNILPFAAAATLAVCPLAGAENKGTVLASLQAPVMVNQGDSYRAASEGMTLSAGDRLMVMNGGAASVAYPNGCVLEVGANEMVRIDTGEACATSAATAGTYQQAGATGGGAAAGAGLSTLAEAGIFVAAAVGAAAYAENESDDQDASR